MPGPEPSWDETWRTNADRGSLRASTTGQRCGKSAQVAHSVCHNSGCGLEEHEMSALARMLTHIPAGMSVLRLLAVPWVVKLARRGARDRCCAAIATLVGIDLADGILARRIGDPVALRRQRRMDSAADLAFAVATPLCVRWVRRRLLRTVS